MTSAPTTPKLTTAKPFSRLPAHPAMARLRAAPNWVAWDYRWIADKSVWAKIPINPHSGDPARSNSSASWGAYEAAETRALQEGLAGVGYMLADGDGLEGGDLDDCRDPATGELDEWAQAIVGLNETYCEVSPSGRGVRMFFDGKQEKAIAFKPAGVELYSRGRYLTITGDQVPGTPQAITSAPAMRAAMVARVEAIKAAARAAKPAGTRPIGPGHNSGKAPDFFRRVNNAALARLTDWVPALFGAAATFNSSTKGYRVPSSALGRDLQEDLSITPMGIADFGVHDMGDQREGRRTAIDLVMEHGEPSDAVEAAHWICKQLDIDPDDLGWLGDQPDPDDGVAPSVGQARGTALPKYQMHQGLPVPMLRDPMQIKQAIEKPEPFPLDFMPTLFREAVDALVEHVQAPEALCAHSILGAAALVSQAHANVVARPLPTSRPLSLYMLALAASGERKSACDSLALYALEEVETERRIAFMKVKETYAIRKQAHAAEQKRINSDKQLGIEQRFAALERLREPLEPLLPHMRVKEPTFEGLTNLLHKGRGSIGLFTSEGGQFIGGHGMSDDAKVRTITGLSALWDDGSAQRVRAGDISYIDNRRVSVSLAVQPRLASGLLSDETARDQGFLGRFLIMMPESTIGTRIVRDSEPLKDPRLSAFHRRCRLLLDREPRMVDETRNELAPVEIHLGEDAQRIWRRFAQQVENACGPGGVWAPISSTALKMAENVARIAGVLAVFENPAILDEARPEIDGYIMAAATFVGDYYLIEARRLIGRKATDAADNDADELADWLNKKWPHDLISPRLIQQKAPNHLRGTVAQVRGRVRALQEAGVLDLVGPGAIDGKNFKETYRINREEGEAAIVH